MTEDMICNACIYGRNCINGKYCLKKQAYVEHHKLQTCDVYINRVIYYSQIKKQK